MQDEKGQDIFHIAYLVEGATLTFVRATLKEFKKRVEKITGKLTLEIEMEVSR